MTIREAQTNGFVHMVLGHFGAVLVFIGIAEIVCLAMFGDRPGLAHLAAVATFASIWFANRMDGHAVRMRHLVRDAIAREQVCDLLDTAFETVLERTGRSIYYEKRRKAA